MSKSVLDRELSPFKEGPPFSGFSGTPQGRRDYDVTPWAPVLCPLYARILHCAIPRTLHILILENFLFLFSSHASPQALTNWSKVISLADCSSTIYLYKLIRFNNELFFIILTYNYNRPILSTRVSGKKKIIKQSDIVFIVDCSNRTFSFVVMTNYYNQ